MRVVVLSTRTVGEFQRNVLRPVFESPEFEIVGACVDCRPAKPPLQKLKKQLRKGRGGYVLVMAAQTVAARLRPQPRATAAADFFRAQGVPVLGVTDLYAPETVAFIAAREPDCMFLTGFGIIREPLLSLAPRGIVSFHHGDMRRYRGMPVAFWELYNGEREMGVTVQILSEELDAGKIVVEKRVPIYESDSWKTLRDRAFRSSEPMLFEALTHLAGDGFEPQALGQGELGRLYTTPNLRQWSALQAKTGARRLRARVREGRSASDRTLAA